MKKFSLLSILSLAMIMASCEGPVGPPGPPGFDGLDGLDGINILGKVLEIEGTFTSFNEPLFYEFPQDVEVFESDIVLVYILWEVAEDNNGEFVDVWRLLPQTRLLDQGILQYNFDHTFFDVSIFLEGNFDFATLGPEDTDNQIFRIAIMPAEFGLDETFDPTDMDAVLDKMKISDDLISRDILD